VGLRLVLKFVQRITCKVLHSFKEDTQHQRAKQEKLQPLSFPFSRKLCSSDGIYFLPLCILKTSVLVLIADFFLVPATYQMKALKEGV